MAEAAQSRAHKEIAAVLHSHDVTINVRMNLVGGIPRQGNGAKIKVVVRA